MLTACSAVQSDAVVVLVLLEIVQGTVVAIHLITQHSEYSESHGWWLGIWYPVKTANGQDDQSITSERAALASAACTFLGDHALRPGEFC